MLRNYLITAWRNAARDRLYAILNVTGLALGLAAAILIGIYVRDELNFDGFLPDAKDVYRVQETIFDQGRPPTSNESSMHGFAAALKLDFPEIIAATRLAGQSFGMRHGDVEAIETVMSVDPDFFRVLGYPLLRGDAATALQAPDAVVLSKAEALKYFGTIDCLGQTVEFDRKYTARVTGVLAEVPSTSNNDFDVLLSGSSSFAELNKDDAMPPVDKGDIENDTETYIRLKPGTDPATLRSRLDRFTATHYPPDDSTPDDILRLWFRPLPELHLSPDNPDTAADHQNLAILWALSITGGLILVVAAINFVNLVTARAMRRSVEVGVRKAVGATRAQLFAQFIGESVGFALIALVLAVAIVELTLPRFNIFLDRDIGFAYWRDPGLALALLGTALLVGLVGGIYPALVQSSFRPALVLKSRAAGTPGSGKLRQALVLLQFSVSIGLLIATSVIYRQTQYAVHASLSFRTDQIVTIDMNGVVSRDWKGGQKNDDRAGIVETLKTRLAAIQGVRQVAGSWVVPNAHHESNELVRVEGGGAPRLLTLDVIPVDYGFFDLFQLHPVAGRDFDLAHHDDATPLQPHTGQGTAIINEAAVAVLGFASPRDAIGHGFIFGDPTDPGQVRQIVGVVPDMQLRTARTKVPATAFVIEPSMDEVLSLKLDGQDVAATLNRVDAVWRELVPSRPILRSFMDQRIEGMYRNLIRQQLIFAGFAVVAMAIGCLGLFGLSAFTAERRTKEIGVRKALGASTGDVVRLLVWQFVQAVFAANLIAWPLSWLFMQRWLDGFAYRIQLGVTVFVLAGLGALAVAIATTSYQVVQVARSRPINALRYE